jgi:hypothetical protein
LKLMLDVSSDNGRRSFGPQAQRSTIAIDERVHLLRDHVGLFADTAHKKFRRLEDRRPYFLESVRVKNVTDARFYRVPDFDITWKKVVGPSNSVDHSVFLCISR